MRYLSVCSGIEAATTAWHPLGWEPAAFSEIERFPSEVLAHHHPDVPNLGDMTKYKEWPDVGPVDLLVGGTPCQSFSVAGLRRGLADPRGNLMLTFGAIADHHRPRWLVWENVPGVLSSGGGRDFGTFLGMLGLLGYGFAYRILDAQYFGVAQRRRRVFVVGHLGDWRAAAAVLFESQGLRWDPPPRREARKVAPTLPASGAGTGRTGNERTEAEFLVEEVSSPLLAQGNKTGGDRPPGTTVDTTGTLVVMATGQGKSEMSDDGCAPALTCNHEAPILAHALRASYDASEDGTGRGTPLVPCASHWDGDYPHPTLNQSAKGSGGVGASNQEVFSQRGAYLVPGEPIPFDETQITHPENRSNPKPGDPSPTLSKGARPPTIAINARQDPDCSEELSPPMSRKDTGHAVAFTCSEQANGFAWEREYAPTINAQVPNDSSNVQTGVRIGATVRRLTPRECERLQGFPDDYTRIAAGTPDGPRYKALGNSMAVPVMAWIGRRIDLVEQLLKERR